MEIEKRKKKKKNEITRGLVMGSDPLFETIFSIKWPTKFESASPEKKFNPAEAVDFRRKFIHLIYFNQF